MADYTEQERADLQRQLMEEMRAYGQITSGTADSLRDAQVGVKGFSKQVRTSATDVAAAYSDLAKQIYQNKQGLSVFNNAIETTATAVAAFGLLMGGPVVKAVSVALIGLAKAIGLANEQTDASYRAYSRLAEVGGTAADQLSGLERDSAKLGYVIADNTEGLNSFGSLIADNADTLALFKGTVFEGRQAIADVGLAMEANRNSLRRMGLTVDQQNKGMVAYIRLQTTLGQAQNKTMAELAAGANKYLLETTALASITGQQRKDVEAEMQRALGETKFRAKIDELYATNQEGLAKEYMALNVMLAKQSPEAAAGFRAMVGGSLEAVESQKLLRSTNGQVISTLDALNKGQINGLGAFNEVAGAVGKFGKGMNKTAQLTSAFDEAFVKYAEGSNLELASRKDMTKEYELAMKQGLEQRENTEDNLKKYANAADANLDTALTMQGIIKKFTTMAATISEKMSEAMNTVTHWVSSLLSKFTSVFDYIQYDILKMPKPGTARAGPTGLVGEELNQQQYAYWKSIAKNAGMQAVPKQWRDVIEEEQKTGKAPSWKTVPPNTAGSTSGQALTGDRMQKYLQSIALAESGGRANVGAGTSSAQGLFQFTKDTWEGVTKRMGKNWTLEDRNDPMKAAEAAAFLTRQNAQVYEKQFGRGASNEELYALHFLGSGGGPAFLKALAANPDGLAKDAVGEAAANSNPDIFFEKGTKRARSLAEVWNIISNKQQQGMMGAVSGMWGKAPVSQAVSGIPQLNRGGVVSGPDSGFLANLHGREAVIPLPNGDSIPVAFNTQELVRNLNEAVRSSGSSGSSGLTELLSGIQDMVRLQRDQNDLLGRMLQHQRA
jgi:hypothetical protein